MVDLQKPHVPFAGVVGHPISHSLSPALHTAAYRALGRDMDYRAVDIMEGHLGPYVDQLRADPLWCGLSVTMPLKAEAAVICDEVNSLGAAVGVVNTVFPGSGGALIGENTDVFGIVGALQAADDLPACPTVAVLGGGATAASAVAAAQVLGADGVDVWVRSIARSRTVIEAAERLGVKIELRPWGEATEYMAGYDVVMATLPPHGCDELAAAFAAARGRIVHGVLLDVAYHPWPSVIAKAWEKAGGVVAPGLDMLIFQALNQIALFTGIAVDSDTAQRKIALEAMRHRVGRRRQSMGR